MKLDRLRPYLQGQQEINWNEIERQANNSFKLNTTWELSRVQINAAQDGASLKITDSKVIEQN